MEKILIGYISATHALKGDLIIKSKFSKIDEVLKINNIIYFGDEKHTITKVQPYKGNYLIQIDNLSDINLVEKNIGKDVFIERSKDFFSIEDLIGYKIISNNKEYGTVKSFIRTNTYILEISYEKDYMIPYNDEFIIKVDPELKQIIIKDVEMFLV